MFRILVLLTAIAGLAGCATPPLTADQCSGADWYKIGVEDGKNGIPDGKLKRYDAECAGFDVLPDEEGYQRGRAVGLTLYCSAEQGFVAGYKGHTYYDVCPEAAEKVFYPQYVLGNELNRVENRIFELENDLRIIEDDLRRYRRNSKWEDRRYSSWRMESLYSRLHWLCAEEFRLRSQVASLYGNSYLRPRVGRFGSFY